MALEKWPSRWDVRRRGLTFRTIQVCLDDLLATLWQAEPADGGHSQAGGRLMCDMRRRKFITLLAVRRRPGRSRRARNSREQGRLQNHILFWHKNNYRDAEAIGHRT